ncbi:MAG: hypothetical protein JSV43_03595 [Methanobacteriota archaeon]|nr:MAG: hypothetical protein JSV43_03595 [Euryarchaeota archaeon]
MGDSESVDWEKTIFMKYSPIYIVVVCLAVYFTIAFLPPNMRGIYPKLILFPFCLLAMLVCFLALLFHKSIPRKYGISVEKLYVQYRDKLDTYRWNEVSRIYIQKTRGNVEVIIESVDKRVNKIAFLMKGERKKIIDCYENLKRRSKPA